MARVTGHNVVATYPGFGEARKALKALNEAGIDAGDISLLGRDAQEATTKADTRARDQASTGDVARHASRSAAVGSAIGGIVGAAAFAIPGIGPVIGAGIFAAAGGGAIAGAVAGSMVGAINTTELGPEWEVTYGAPLRQGKVLVAAHARDSQQAAKATKALSDAGASRVDHVDEGGRPLAESQRS